MCAHVLKTTQQYNLVPEAHEDGKGVELTEFGNKGEAEFLNMSS